MDHLQEDWLGDHRLETLAAIQGIQRDLDAQMEHGRASLEDIRFVTANNILEVLVRRPMDASTATILKVAVEQLRSPSVCPEQALSETRNTLRLLLDEHGAATGEPPASVAPVEDDQCDKQKIRTQIRWIIRRDMPEVLAIEAASFEFPWMEDDFIRCLRQRNCVGMIAEYDDQVVGYMVYELNRDRIQLLSFAVAPEMRRMGVGTQMVRKLVGKLSAQCRTHILLEVRETNLAAQVFFRNEGFRAISVLKDYYEDTPEDAYLMQHRFEPQDSRGDEPFEVVTIAGQHCTSSDATESEPPSDRFDLPTPWTPPRNEYGDSDFPSSY